MEDFDDDSFRLDWADDEFWESLTEPLLSRWCSLLLLDEECLVLLAGVSSRSTRETEDDWLLLWLDEISLCNLDEDDELDFFSTIGTSLDSENDQLKTLSLGCDIADYVTNLP